MKVLGIDEAGRGALVGPLVIGGFMIEEGELELLKDKGVKDSKQLKPKEREELSTWLKSKGKSKIIKVSPQEIDMKNSVGFNLNRLEIEKMIKIIEELRPDKVIIDCPSHNEPRIKALFEAKVNCEVVCECKADEKYPIVGAGSILAKHERDNSIRLLERDLKTVIGAGYPSDERTVNFARKALSKPEWLVHVRKSWQTYQELVKGKEQRKLGDWG